MTKQNAENTIRVAGVIVCMILGVGGVLLAVGAQNQKLNAAVDRQKALEITVGTHERSIATLEANIQYLVKSMDEVKAAVKK